MARLEDIPKKQFFTTPEDYFEDLPGKIQARVTAERPISKKQPFLRYALQYALPLVIIIASIVYYNLRPSTNPENILASVETEDIILYLQESGMTTDEVLESIDFTSGDLEALENEVYDIPFSDPQNDGADTIK